MGGGGGECAKERDDDHEVVFVVVAQYSVDLGESSSLLLVKVLATRGFSVGELSAVLLHLSHWHVVSGRKLDLVLFDSFFELNMAIALVPDENDDAVEHEASRGHEPQDQAQLPTTFESGAGRETSWRLVELVSVELGS